MQLKPAQLENHLTNQLSPCYLISGDEPLLVQECADAIRAEQEHQREARMHRRR